MSNNDELDMNDPKVQKIMQQCMNMLSQNMNMNMNNMNMNNMNMANMNMANMNNMNMFMQNMNMNPLMMNNFMNMMNNPNFMNNMNCMNMNMMNMMNMNGMNNMNNMWNNNGNNNGMNNINNMPNSMNNLNNNMSNSFNIQNNNNNMSYSSGNVISNNRNQNQQPQELIPRGDKVIRDTSMNINSNGQNMINVTFDASTGLRVIIAISKNTTVKQLVEKYIERIGIGKNHIGKDIIFLFNGGKMDPFSEDNLQNFPDLAIITVFDQNNVIGA